MYDLNELVEDTDVFEMDAAVMCVDQDCVVERVSSIKPPGKGDSGMAEERG
ncbi:hypothetical protein [Polyangium aurulentum]|uniref:hypothetical protein n=1 Tax=Polyangium aurulentum TaxID=2567896 RepID=UPI00146C29A9|nr:hypothetical protein [Polyangium aurulentum]UQA55473.1 hypothetical protein E8A73_029515 [Polyangium aurulentum]